MADLVGGLMTWKHAKLCIARQFHLVNFSFLSGSVALMLWLCSGTNARRLSAK